jgi:hypothetical protein
MVQRIRVGLEAQSGGFSLNLVGCRPVSMLRMALFVVQRGYLARGDQSDSSIFGTSLFIPMPPSQLVAAQSPVGFPEQPRGTATSAI